MSTFGARHTSEECHDTLAARVVPIVVVPGVMGSRIDIGPGRMTWDPDSLLSMLQWTALSEHAAAWHLWVDVSPRAEALHNLAVPASVCGKAGAPGDLRNTYRAEKGLAPGAHVDDADLVAHYEGRGWGGVAWDFYGPMLLWLEREFNAYVEREGVLVPGDDIRCPVYAFGYDWRQSNALSGARLRSFVTSRPLRDYPDDEVQQVILLTHSMGGLVARWACVGDGGADFSDKVRGVIHCALPSNGAIAFYRRCFTGCVERYNDNGGEWGANKLMGDTWWRWLASVAGARGPMQLLPSHTYQDGYPKVDPHWIQAPTAAGGARAGYDVDRRSTRFLDPQEIYAEYAGNEWYGVCPPSALFAFNLQVGNNYLWPRLTTTLGDSFTSAAAFYSTLKTNGGWHACTFVLFSDILMTDEAMVVSQSSSEVLRDVETFAITWKQGKTGDGSVPRRSAACRGGDQSRIKGRFDFSLGDHLDHGSVLKSTFYRNRIFLYVRAIVTDDPANAPAPPAERWSPDDTYYDCELAP